MITSLFSAFGTLQQGQSLVSGTTSAVSNLVGGTKGTCSRIPTEHQIAHIIAAADPNEPAMKRTRERFGRAESERKAYIHLVPNRDPNMLIYHAPIGVVSAWARYDCSSAGPIRQSLADDLQSLWQKYGASSLQSFGAAPAAPSAIQPISGGIHYDDGRISGGVSFGDPVRQPAPAWVKIAFGALLVLALFSVITGRAGRTTRGLR